MNATKRLSITMFTWKPVLLAMAAAMAVCSVNASVAVGENILINGALEADQLDFPQGWVMERPEYDPAGGPDSMPSVTFTYDGDGTYYLREMKQSGFRLSSNGRYRISAWVRPRDGFYARRFGLCVSNKDGKVARGLNELPPVGKWTRVANEFSGFKSEGDYSCTVSMYDFHGSLDIADLRLEALDESAAAGSEKAQLSKYQSAPRIVPWGPLLGEIPKTPREVSFRFLGQLPNGCGMKECDMALKADGMDDELSQPIDSKSNTFKLPDGADGGMMYVRVVHRATGSNIVERAFRYRTVDVPSPDLLKKHRRLNNYVTEVLHEKVAASGATTLPFGIARRKWVVIAVKSEAAFSLSLDGEKVIDAATPRHEAFREVASGDHRISIEGLAAGDEITVRTIPETLNWAPVPSQIKALPPYDWDFQRKYAFPAVTTMNSSSGPKGDGEMEEYRASGRIWLANLHTTKPKSPDDIASRLKSAKGMTLPIYDGVTCDEQFCGRDEANSHYMLGLRKYDLEEKPVRRIYTWLVGKPISGMFDTEYLADCANVALGRGRVLIEMYCRSKATEAEARTALELYVCGAMQQFRSVWPEIPYSMGLILGNFTQIPICSIHGHCEMDYRCYLDMQFNMLANDPAMEGLGVAGYWGSHYTDDDTLRWCFKLLRHYCIDGATDMLSGKYGLKYNPGFVRNPDFKTGLDGWRIEGSVSRDVVEGFGRPSLKLLGTGSCGESFAVFARGDGPNRISQKMSGFIPGETYRLQFVTFDANDAKAHRFAPRKIAIAAELGSGAKILPERTWRYVDRQSSRPGKSSGARVNLNYIMFEAKAPEIELSFNDAAAKPGERLGLNWINLVKYLK